MSTPANIALDRASVSKINNAIEDATGLPNHVYTSEAFFEFERDRLYAKQWAG